MFAGRGAKVAAAVVLVAVIAVGGMAFLLADDDSPSAPQPTTSSTGPSSSSTDATASSTSTTVAPLIAQPPAPGTYDYTVLQGSGEDIVANSASLEVQNLRGGRAGVTVRQALVFTFRNTTRRDVTWTVETGRLVVDALRETEANGTTTECSWQPPLVDLASSLAVGSSWTNDTTCTYETAEGSVTRRIQEQAEVTERRLSPVGGEQVDTVVIERSVRITSRGAVAYVQEVETVDVFAPLLGISVRTANDVSTTVDPPDGEPVTDSRRIVIELRSTEPS